MIKQHGSKPHNNRRAVTFVEVLIATFVIGVGVLPVLAIFLTGTRKIESGGVIFQVSIAAQNIMDRVRSDTFMWQEMPVKLVIPSNNTRGLYLPADLIEKYKAVADVSIDLVKEHYINGTGSPEDRLYQIDVAVNWIDNGVKKRYELMNYRANTNYYNIKASTRFE